LLHYIDPTANNRHSFLPPHSTSAQYEGSDIFPNLIPGYSRVNIACGDPSGYDIRYGTA
jgi:hypothetical protein